MFHTYAEAEQYLPPLLLSPGEKCWRWIELSITAPCFFLSFVAISDEAKMRLQYLCLHSADVVNLLAPVRASIGDIRVGLLSPAHLNGTSSYQFAYLRQIWRYEDGTEVFCMEDGGKVGVEPTGAKRDMKKKLVLAV